MNLDKKKKLAIRTLKVGEKRISFSPSRLNEIKEAITKQDIKDLHKDGAIVIKEIKGRRKNKKKKKKKSTGNIRKNVKKRKKEYTKITRKLRKTVAGLKEQGRISNAEKKEIRKKIRNRVYKSKAHMKSLVMGEKK